MAQLKTLLLIGVVVFIAVFAAMFLMLFAASGGLGPMLLTLFVLLVVTITAWSIYQGMIIRVVQHHDDGREHSLEDLYASVKPVLVPLILTSILTAAFLLGGLIMLVVPAIVFYVYLAVVAPIVVVERVKYMDALARSWNLIKGSAWTAFGVLIVFGVLVGIANTIISEIGSAIGDEVGNATASFVAQVFLGPFLVIAGAVMYFMLSETGAPVGASGAGMPPAGMPGAAPSVSGSVPPPPPPPGS
ncbi:MAG: hypothetical protein WDZ37_01260 [Solirubrobacterales bacterium]